MYKIITLALLILTSGCATTHSGTRVQVNEDLVVSATVRKELSTNYFTLIEITFENTGKTWMSFVKPMVDLGDARLNDAVIVVSGQDLRSWAESMEAKKNISDKNLQTFLGSIGLVGILTSGMGGNDTLKKTEAAIGITAIAAYTVSKYKHSLEAVRDVKVLPSTHLYAEDMRLAPGLFLKRWVLFYSPTTHWISSIEHIDLNYKNAQDAAKTVTLPLKSFSPF